MSYHQGTQYKNNMKFPCDWCKTYASDERYHAPHKKIICQDGLKCLIFYSQTCYQNYITDHERYDLYFKVVNN